MPDVENSPKGVWHGVPREQIVWHPTVEHELCIGCGLCVLGCGANVYAFDYERSKPIVIAPSECKVGCVTCANTCPVHAIGFPPLSYLHKTIKTKNVLATSRNELKEKKEQVAYKKKRMRGLEEEES